MSNVPNELPNEEKSTTTEQKEPITDSNSTQRGKKKKSSKKSRDPATLTPEYIEEQRRQRNLKKEKKKQELLAQGIDPNTVNTPVELRFRTRELLELPNNVTDDDSFKIKIMSYNILAQALIRRKLFPTSGNALKWSTRSQVLLSEFKHYDADILCLQELDFIQYNSYWRKELGKLGYEMKYYRADTKNHGLAIAFKTDKFICKHQSFIYYDKETSGELRPRTATQNIGLLACLDFTPQILSKYSNISRNGIIIGTTHLFWHPFGTFERTRQTYLILKKFKEFASTMNTLKGNDKDWYSFFAGDFNSQPFDAPYLSISAKPAKYADRARTVLGCSLSYQYSKNRGVIDNDNSNEDEEDEQEEEEEGGNIEKFGTNQPKDPVPESFEPTPEQLKLVNSMQDLHNSLDMRAISLYSVGYKLVDPDNSGLDNDRDEPIFSNWAHAWRGLLDYIFVISSWDDKNESFADKIDTVKDVEQNNGVRITRLLKLPLPKDMGPEPSGQPRLGQYPSDHLCLMAEVALC
ncbi:uncharacterized protein AC631_03200 [Debaryomyces fabryi]|uniref:Endonuclease/exonuclease/phosphatase domain-containing protein n=1 Tax=Debaryomyces fabryi TaxID=58627 RepID=A0A0V1PY64_9ASCO|nr:uncharacterized protein AC631_03200 [Debaryomyces fabryi]KSA01013.1 hypothetical protein AC631_03200 [Debaryomyces fabryi]